MIQLHNVTGEPFLLNNDLIYRVDSQYDTVITLTNQKKLIVKEKPEEIVEKVIEFNQKIHSKWRNDKQ